MTVAVAARGKLRRVTAAQAIGVALVANLGLAAGKLAYGRAIGSIGLQADGFHNLVDALGSVVAYLAARVAAQPPDHDHPYGHARIELLGALGVGLFIAAGALEIGLSGLGALWQGAVPPQANPLGILAVFGSTGVGLAVSSWEAHVTRDNPSLLVEADVRHQRLDVLGTGVVALGLVAGRLGLARADAFAALLVLGVVGHGAYEILARSALALSDTTQIPPDEVAKVIATIPLIRGCHKIRSRGAPGAIHVDLHIQVDPTMPIVDAHALGHAAKARVEARFPGVVDVLVHVEPDEAEDHD